MSMKKIIKPGQLGLLHKPYRHRQQDYLVVSALMFFEIGGDGSLLSEHESWPRILPQLGPMQVLDECMPKQGAEVLVVGDAFAPAGTPVTGMDIRLCCGMTGAPGIDKTLHISGERRWRYGLMPLQQIDKPQPFVQMPTDLSRAWGGAQFSENPLGRGYTDSKMPALFASNEGEMPNVQFPGQRLKPGQASHTPAGFGPLPIGVKQRQQYTGSYNKAWLKNDFPGLAKNIDWRFFNMAPQDQWLAQPFSGAETFSIEGMHPQQPVLEGQLPAYRPRAFVGNDAEPCREVELKADTLWLLPGQKLAVLIWHGQTEVSRSDAQDMQQLLLAVDRAEAPRSQAYFNELMALRTDPATAADHAFNEAQLLPPVAPLTGTEKAAQAAADAADEQARADQLAALQEDFRQRHQLPPVPAVPQDADTGSAPSRSLDIPLPSARELDNGQIDLSHTRKAAEQQLAASQARAEQKLAKLKARTAGAVGKASPAPLSAAQVLAQADPLQRQQQLQARFAYAPLSPAQREQLNDQSIELLAQQQLALRYQREPGEQPLADEAVSALSDLVQQRLQRGESLAGFDLTGVVLEQMDLTGQDLRGVNFERALLRGCDFSASQLEGSSFLAATLNGCVFDQAVLNKTNWAQARLSSCQLHQSRFVESQWAQSELVDCSFNGSNLSQSQWQDISLRSVSLADCQLDQSCWVQLDARHCSWQGSRADKLSWLGCQLDDCDLSLIEWKNAALLHCVVQRCRLQQVNLFKVLITGAEGESQWAGSDWQQARLEECGLRATDLKGSNWTDARLLRCDLGATQLQQAQARGALFSQSTMMGAQLQGAQLQDADFYGTVLRQAELDNANLTDAQLFGADMTEASLIDTDATRLWPEIVSPGVKRSAA